MSRTTPLVLGMSCFFATPVTAQDLVIPVSQSRWVSVSAYATDFSGSDQESSSVVASDFGLFEADTTVTASVPFANASGSGTQTSQIQATSMQASGDISASAESVDYEALGMANAESYLEVSFDLTGPASYTLSGNIGASGLQCSTTVALDGPSGSIVAISARNQPMPVLETGSLPPGTYTLTADAVGQAFGDFFVSFAASAGYDLHLSFDPVTATVENGPSGNTFVASPNPFRDRISISYGTTGVSAYDVTIFDVRGRLVRTLGEVSGAGSFSWDGRNDAGELVQAGVYFVRLKDREGVHRLKVARIR